MICSNCCAVWVPANLLVFTVVPVPLRIGFIQAHVARVADGLVLPHAPALVLSFLTVVLCLSYVWRVDGVKTGFQVQLAEAAFCAEKR